MTVYLASYKAPGTIIDRFIRLWTGSIYSHSELVIDGMCYTSSGRDKGVRRKAMALPPEKWDLQPLPWADRHQIERYFQATRKHRYGYLRLLLTQMFNLGSNEAFLARVGRVLRMRPAPFCSDWIAAALGLPAAGIYNPGALHDLCRWITDNTEARHSPGFSSLE